MAETYLTSLTPLVVADGLTEMQAAIGTRDKRGVTEKAAVYFKHLDGVSAPAFRAAVTTIIREDRYFPTISRIRAAAGEWQARQPRRAEREFDSDHCAQCGCAWRAVRHWRPRMVTVATEQFDRPLFPMLSDDGEYVLLEHVDRLGCDCTPPSQIAPIDDVEPPIAPLNALSPLAGSMLVRHGKARWAKEGHLVPVRKHVESAA